MMQKHKGWRKQEGKRSLYGRGLRWVKICAFSNLEVPSTSSSCSCTGCVEVVLTAKQHPSLEFHWISENTDKLMIPPFLEMGVGGRHNARAYHKQKKTSGVPRDLCWDFSTNLIFPKSPFFWLMKVMSRSCKAKDTFKINIWLFLSILMVSHTRVQRRGDDRKYLIYTWSETNSLFHATNTCSCNYTAQTLMM